jgi:hypothetical protein
MKTKLFFLFAIVAGLGMSSVQAQAVHKRSKHESARIKQGVHSGELTRVETKRLANEQRNIHQDIRSAKMDDGKIGPHERREINRDQARASRHIYRAKHNSYERF